MPIGFAAFAYAYEGSTLQFKAELTAGRVAKYVYVHGKLWEYQSARIAELIEFQDDAKTVLQQVINPSGKLVLQAGGVEGSRHLVRHASIVVAGNQTGTVVLSTSLDPLLWRTLWVAASSSLLGALAYLAVRVLPLRVLDNTLGALETKNTQLDAALTNMSQGLSMFDAEGRLIVCNARYAQLYGLPAELTRPGTPIAELLLDRDAREQDEVIRDVYGKIANREAVTFRFEMNDGRTISVSHEPMPDGGWVSTHEDITERLRIETEVYRMARHDGLTNLPNRVHLREHLAEALVAVTDRDESLAILCIDLDRFKFVNDTLGHPAGDELLREVAGRLRACLRDADIVARLGGDEFTVLQKGCPQPHSATVLAARIVEALSQPYAIEGAQVAAVGASVGISIAPSDGLDADLLFKNADLALYRAKAEGRGTYRFFEAEMDAQIQARRLLEVDLRSALADDQIRLYYQPLVSVASGCVSGFEALMRWEHPQRGFVPPTEFIPLAEEIGVIASLGQWAINRACTDAASWPSHVNIAVDLSPAQFTPNNSLPFTVAAALAASGLAPSRLELEITETVLLDDSETTLATLHQLRALGVRIALDDFGTGYSSLSYLRKFPFDKIKIDRSFVREVASDGECSAIVHAVVGLATALGMSTTAEGVETEDQLDQLRGEGCTEVQGFLFSQARPLAEATRLIEAVGRQDCHKEVA